MLPSSESLFGFLGLILILAIFSSFHYALCALQSPLSQIPNAHWSSPWSSFWILWLRYWDRELSVLIDKHRKLGPILRLGPADLSISCYENGVRTIYNGGFEKPEYYDFFAYYGRKNAFCSMSRQDHTLRRKRISSAYAKSALFMSEPLFSLTETMLLKRLMPILKKHSVSKEPTDVLFLSYGLSLDLLTCFQFGLASGSNFLGDDIKLKHWLEHYEQRYCKAAFWPQELPTLTRWLKFVGVDMLPKSQYESTRYLEQWLLEHSDRADTVCLDVEKGLQVDQADIPVVYQQVKKAVEVDLSAAGVEVKRDEIASELFDHMSGGREVLGLVLAYTIYYISMRSDVQAKLRSEFASSVQSENTEGGRISLPQPGALDKLPYLSAVLKESFRMRPNSTPLPRVTPNNREICLAGVDGIPPSTRVNTFQWFIHRNPDNYDKVHEWYPERWLDAESKETKDPLLWAFGGGSRTCVGTSLTQYLMRYILFMIYSRFSSKLIFKQSRPHEPGSPEDKILVQFEHFVGS